MVGKMMTKPCWLDRCRTWLLRNDSDGRRQDGSDEMFDEILVQDPANNAPYLTDRGLFVVGAVLLIGMASSLSIFAEWWDIAIFLASVASTTTLFLAVHYTVLLFVWRSTQRGGMTFCTDIQARRINDGTVFQFENTVNYRVGFPVCLEAIRWDVSPHLEIEGPSQDPILLHGCSCLTRSIRMRAKYIGQAAIFGQAVALDDVFHLFRAESHVEIGHLVAVTPVRPKSGVRRLSKLSSAVRQAVQQTHYPVSDEIEVDSIRPWQRGDTMKRILWRGYARRQELTVWKPPCRSQRKLLCVIDAGPRMRLGTSRNPYDTQLRQVVMQISGTVADFDSVIILAYDEVGAHEVCIRETPAAALDALDEWVIETLKWRMPQERDKDSAKLWNDSTFHLAKCFRLYKGIDFEKKDGEKVRVDLKGLVAWSRMELVNTAFKRNDADPGRYMNMGHQEILEELLRYWCRYPEPPLSSAPQTSRIDEVIPLMAQAVRDETPAMCIWYSDFAEHIDKEQLSRIVGMISMGRMPALGIVMEMPLHSPNFIPRVGEVCRTGNFNRLGKVMEFVR